MSEIPDGLVLADELIATISVGLQGKNEIEPLKRALLEQVAWRSALLAPDAVAAVMEYADELDEDSTAIAELNPSGVISPDHAKLALTKVELEEERNKSRRLSQQLNEANFSSMRTRISREKQLTEELEKLASVEDENARYVEERAALQAQIRHLEGKVAELQAANMALQQQLSETVDFAAAALPAALIAGDPVAEAGAGSIGELTRLRQELLESEVAREDLEGQLNDQKMRLEYEVEVRESTERLLTEAELSLEATSEYSVKIEDLDRENDALKMQRDAALRDAEHSVSNATMAEDEHAVVKAQVSQLSLAIEIAKNRAANLELELENVQAQKATVESILAAKSELCERQEETLMQQVEGTLQATGSPPLANGGDGGGDRDRAFLDSPIDIDALTEAQTSRFHAVMALIAEIDSAVSELNDQDAAAEAAAAAASRSDVANTPKPPGSSLVIEDLYDDSPEGKLDREAWDPPDELIRVLKAALATIAEQQVQLQSLAADRKRFWTTAQARPTGPNNIELFQAPVVVVESKVSVALRIGGQGLRYTVIVFPNDIVLSDDQTGRVAVSWPLRALQRFGLVNGLVSLECSNCSRGVPGVFHFWAGDQANALYTALKRADATFRILHQTPANLSWNARDTVRDGQRTANNGPRALRPIRA